MPHTMHKILISKIGNPIKNKYENTVHNSILINFCPTLEKIFVDAHVYAIILLPDFSLGGVK